MQRILLKLNMGFARINKKTVQSDCYDEAVSIRSNGTHEIQIIIITKYGVGRRPNHFHKLKKRYSIK